MRQPRNILIGIGGLSLVIYLVALAYGPFRPGRIVPFFYIFGGLFVVYAVAVWLILKSDPLPTQSLYHIVGFAILFSFALLPMQPTLSDDMFRYVWDGRVQAQGINPYRYPSDAPELAYLRDDAIWKHMNRISAVTLYPPGAQMVFAVLWRLFGDSILAFKAAMVACVLVGGLLLIRLLRILGERPERALIFLWSPLLIFEIAHAGHVDALYLPLMIGALLVRANAPPERVSLKHEAGIGVLLGAAVLTKLYPAILLAPLWSVRDVNGCRRWRLALPTTLCLTVAIGYATYLAPGVDTLGFLPKYTREFFNIGPIPRVLINWAQNNHLPFYEPILVLTPLLIGLMSLYFLAFPAHSARVAIFRCLWPIGIYFILSMNLFSWYILWTLPFVALDLRAGRWFGWGLNPALAWWVFSGLVALSYTLFITGWALDWVSWVEFLPLYAILVGSLVQFVFHKKWADVHAPRLNGYR